MFEKSISESYLADCCGVSKVYMHQALKGTIPMNPTLEKKIENIIGVIDLSNSIQAKKEENKKSAELQELNNRKKELKCTYEEIANHTEHGYNSNYLYTVFCGSRPISKKLYADLIKAFDAIEEERTRPQNDETKPQAKEEITFNDIPVQTFATVKVVPPQAEPLKTAMDNPFKDMLIDIARAYGKSTHSMEFDAEGYHFVFQLDISNVEG